MTDIASVGAIPVGDYLAIFRRQKWRMLMVGVAILTLAATLVAYWPATYRSSATIMISQIELPGDVVSPTASTFAEERLRAIQQRITTTQNLTAIIEKLNLYPDLRRSMAMSQVVDLMRSKIGLWIIGTETTGKPRDSKSPQAAIAFNLWFDAGDPRTAQRVADELVTLYLAENNRDREGRAAVTAEFLKAESLRLEQHVQRLEAAIEKFKLEYAGYLPEDRAVNSQLLDRVETQIGELTREARSLRQRRALLHSELLKTPRYLPAGGEAATLSPEAQLALLEGKRAAMRARYGDKHPDVLAIDRQISALKSTGATSRADGTALAVQIESMATDLEAAKRQYGAKHPDVTRLERELSAAKAQLAAVPAAAGTANGVSNPSYADLQMQLATVENELALTANALSAAEEKRDKIHARILKEPVVEREYTGLKRDYETALQRFLEMRSRQGQAELASNLEADRVGETLSLVEPPVEPVAPFKPNRSILLAIALLVALAGAAATGLLWDVFDGRIHGWRQVMAISGQSPFAVIPVIRTATDRQRNRAGIAGVSALAVLSIVVVLLYIHNVILPLDGLWTGLVGDSGIDAPPTMP
jgi:succinoglycan biosynthesis transport protein ExoP